MPGTSFKLYHDAGLRSVRVKWILHELIDDRFEVEYVDIYGAQQYSPEFLAINPNHAVPVLKIMREDGSSMHMLESHYGWLSDWLRYVSNLVRRGLLVRLRTCTYALVSRVRRLPRRPRL
jgi:glutathione S-transferase